MAITKYASFEVSEILDLKSSQDRQKTASLRTISDFNDYRVDDGYVYARIRAISSRVNKNHDGWPTAEIAGGDEAWEKIASLRQSNDSSLTVESSADSKYGFSTFVGKPIFVDHNNSDPKRARGVIVDAKFNVLDQKTASEDSYWSKTADVDPEHNPPSEIELLIEIDAKSFPKFAKAIVDGDLDGFSMGANIEYSKCSHCGNKASDPSEYCDHIKMKGAEHTHTSSDGTRTSKKSYENCYGIGFFEISGVFDPADETALRKEVRSSVQKETANRSYIQSKKIAAGWENFAPGQGIPFDPNNPDSAQNIQAEVDPRNQNDEYAKYCPHCDSEHTVKTGPMHRHCTNCGNTFMPFVSDESLVNQVYRDQGYPIAGDGIAPEQSVPDIGRPTFGSTQKIAQPAPPQADQPTAPDAVDTLREEKVCPVCASEMQDGHCTVCGYEEPPPAIQNPDLQAAQEQHAEVPNQKVDEISQNRLPQNQQEGSYISARNTQATASVISEMRWAPKEIKTSDSIFDGDEPEEIVISDQTQPVTSAFLTARAMIEAAKQTQENKNMSDKTKIAAEPADPSGAADKRTDVKGVGGIADNATNEGASTPDTSADVEGKGSVLDGSNEEAAAPSVGTESIGDRQEENAGFQEGGQTGAPTQTFPNTNEPDSAVTDKVYAAKEGTQPVDPVGKPQDRVDVDQEVTYTNPNGVADQWTGTEGNGVTKQQSPVTKEELQQGVVTISALKLADTEIEIGILPQSDKYNRIAALSSLSEEEISAELRALSKVKKAGITKSASNSSAIAGRVPAFGKIARDVEPKPQAVDSSYIDAALFN